MLLDTIPVFYKVIFSLFAILFFSRFFKSIFIPLCIGTIALAVALGHSEQESLSIFSNATFNLNTLFLFLVFLEIEFFSMQMAESGTMKRIVAIVRDHLDRRKAMAVLPALVGLLPMPGGAMFSAPLVDNCDENNENDPLLKAKINYWFRHLWEYWWPMFPGVLLAIELSKLDTMQFILLQLPMSFFSALVGYFFLLKKVRGNYETKATRFDRTTINELLKLSAPIAVIIFVYMLVKIGIPRLCAINKYLPMTIGILCGITLLQFTNPIGIRSWIKILSAKSIYMMILLVYGVILYGSLIEGKLPDGTPVAAKIAAEIAATGIPQTALFVAIPFICGLSTGVAIAFVGASFPIIMGMIGANPSLGTLLCTTFIAYGSGYAGMILSPVHVCLIVSNEHFKTELLSSIKRLVLPTATLMILNIGTYFLFRLMF